MNDDEQVFLDYITAVGAIMRATKDLGRINLGLIITRQEYDEFKATAKALDEHASKLQARIGTRVIW